MSKEFVCEENFCSYGQHMRVRAQVCLSLKASFPTAIDFVNLESESTPLFESCFDSESEGKTTFYLYIIYLNRYFTVHSVVTNGHTFHVIGLYFQESILGRKKFHWEMGSCNSLKLLSIMVGWFFQKNAQWVLDPVNFSKFKVILYLNSKIKLQYLKIYQLIDLISIMEIYI